MISRHRLDKQCLGPERGQDDGAPVPALLLVWLPVAEHVGEELGSDGEDEGGDTKIGAVIRAEDEIGPWVVKWIWGIRVWIDFGCLGCHRSLDNAVYSYSGGGMQKKHSPSGR